MSGDSFLDDTPTVSHFQGEIGAVARPKFDGCVPSPRQSRTEDAQDVASACQWIHNDSIDTGVASVWSRIAERGRIAMQQAPQVYGSFLELDSGSSRDI